MKHLPLTKGKVALVDDEDFEWLSQWKWSHHRGGRGRKREYAIRGVWDGERVRTVQMSRVIMNPPTGLQVDHINGNALDNRRCNLRLATPRQNATNTRKWGTASRYKGVYPRGRRWLALISPNGQRTRLGTYDTEEQAARAYDEAARIHFGTFASLNFPLSPSQE